MLYEKWDNEDRTSGVCKVVSETEDGVVVETSIMQEDQPGNPERFPTEETFTDSLEDVIATLVADGFKKAKEVQE